MLSWSVITDVLKPRYWFTWLWGGINGGYSAPTSHSATPQLYLITEDTCAKCSRFISYHSKNNGYCSFHNVSWTKEDKVKSYDLFKGPFEMWLRSRCGGDIDESRINTNLLTLASFLDYAKTHSQTNGNLYDFCDKSFCDYQMVYDFLIDLRTQAQDARDALASERHTIDTELRICQSMQRFIEFRKFQLPIKGIVENRYSATERVLDTYRRMLLTDQRATVDLASKAITSADVHSTINHFMPQYDIITDYLQQCDNVRSMENGCDLEFSTSFICAYLYSLMPQHVPFFHMVRVRDLYPPSAATLSIVEPVYQQTESPQFVSKSCENLPSPAIASACISKLQKCLALDEGAKAMINSYLTFIRPRISTSNDYLLLSSSGLGLTSCEVYDRIVTLIYRVTGKVVELVDTFEPEDPSTPLIPSSLRKGGARSTTQPLKRVKFSRVVAKKLLNKYSRNKMRKKRKLIIDLTRIA